MLQILLTGFGVAESRMGDEKPVHQRLIIFTRYPEPGHTKTRLIPLLGPEGAAKLHRAMAERTLNQARRLEKGVSLEVRYAGGTQPLMEQWLGGDILYSPQGEGDLGQRMARAFEEAFQSGMESVVLVGTDCPGLTGALLHKAFYWLTASDVVLGPARDGGYYLIGLRRSIPQLFIDMPWGTREVLQRTTQRIKELGLPGVLLEELDDVDRPEDLPLWGKVLFCPRDPASLSRVSIIIPALNEAATIVPALLSIRNASDAEIIVVDGGSADETAALASACGARVLTTPAGRARQMNDGAAEATGDILIFLHADTRLPEGFEHHIREILSRPGTAAGAFELRIDAPMRTLRVIEKIANLRSRWLRMPYGDQAIFVKADLFRDIGGFPDIPIMEDFELIRRLRRRGRIAIAPVAVVTSARRWKSLGVWRTTLINQIMVLAYYLRVSPYRMALWYQRSRGISGSL